MKLQVLDDERFTCGSCTNCCRHWHVELLPGEEQRIAGLKLVNDQNVLLRHAGKTFLAHRPNGACVFLNESNGRCLIHEQFGADPKPLGCRLFPFQISPTFPGAATVTARYECPTVRKNHGEPHSNALPD